MISIKCETCPKIVAIVESAMHVPTSGEILCRACGDKAKGTVNGKEIRQRKLSSV